MGGEKRVLAALSANFLSDLNSSKAFVLHACLHVPSIRLPAIWLAAFWSHLLASCKSRLSSMAHSSLWVFDPELAEHLQVSAGQDSE